MTAIPPPSLVRTESQPRPIPVKGESFRDLNAMLKTASPTGGLSPVREWSDLIRGKDQRDILSRMLDSPNVDVEDLEALESLSEAIKGKIDDASPVHSPRKFAANFFGHRADELREIKLKIELIKDQQKIVSICHYLASHEELLQTEGLFRVCGIGDEPSKWIESVHADIEELAKNVHNMTTALKQLVGKRLMFSEQFKDYPSKCVTEKGEIRLDEIVHFREDLYKASICYPELFQLLHKISLQEESNKMTVANLRICIIPRLVFHSDSQVLLDLMNKWAPIVEWIIQNPFSV